MKGLDKMAKAKGELTTEKETKNTKEPKEPKEPKEKERKSKKDDKVFIGRVKKVVKKSRRKMSEEKFEKQLQRTITFLEEIQAKLNKSQNHKP